MGLQAKQFTINFDDLTKAIDVDDSAGRSVPINMNFVDEGFLTKDTGYELFGDATDKRSHSLFHYKKKDGTSYIIRALGTALQKYDETEEDFVDISSGDVTITIATPAVVSLTNHGLKANSKFRFETTGALPTGITAGTTYYVISTGLTANAFQFSETQGGSAVNTSGTQSGTHSIYRVYTEDAEFGFYVYDDELFGCNAVENYFKFDGTLFTEFSSAPKGNNLEIFEDRMFVSGVTAEPLSLYYSDVGDPETFDPASVLKPLGTDTVKTQKNYYGVLLIFKEKSIWKLTFIYDQILDLFVPKLEIQSGTYGACSRKSVAWVENDLWFFTGEEVRAIGFVDQQTGVFGINKSVISENIKETLKLIRSKDNVVVAYNNRRFYLGVSLQNTSNNVDTIFVCHLLYGNNWTKYTARDKANVFDFLIIEDDIYTSKSTEDFGIIKWSSSLNDLNTAISSSVLFKRLEDKDFNRFRTFRYLGLMFKDLSANVRVTIKQESSDSIESTEKTFAVGTGLNTGDETSLGQVTFGEELWAGGNELEGTTFDASPFVKKKVSFLSKNQALLIGLANDQMGETFTIARFNLFGKEQPRKLFSPSKIISVN